MKSLTNVLNKELFQFTESSVCIKDADTIVCGKDADTIVCGKDADTIVCGKLELFDYKDLEDKFTFEPFFGECDLFGF